MNNTEPTIKFNFLEEDFEDYNIVEFHVPLDIIETQLLIEIGGYSSTPNIWNFPNDVTAERIESIVL